MIAIKTFMNDVPLARIRMSIFIEYTDHEDNNIKKTTNIYGERCTKEHF